MKDKNILDQLFQKGTRKYNQYVKDRKGIDLYEGDIIKLASGTVGIITPNGYDYKSEENKIDVYYMLLDLTTDRNLHTHPCYIHPSRDDMEKSRFLGNGKKGIKLIKKHYNCKKEYKIMALLDLYTEANI